MKDMLREYRRVREEDCLDRLFKAHGIDPRGIEACVADLLETDATVGEALCLGMLMGAEGATLLHALEIVLNPPTDATDTTGSGGRVRPGLRRRP